MGRLLDELFERAERELKSGSEETAMRMKVARAGNDLAAGVERLAQILSTDPSAGNLNTREMALRLWARGVRV